MKHMRYLLVLTTALGALPATAGDMPDLGLHRGKRIVIGESNEATMPAAPNLLSKKQARLNKKEQRAAELAREWMNRNDMPTRGHDGSVVFNYGSSLPTVVCAPLYPCNLLLEPGEVVKQIDVGDKIRWHVTPSTFGEGDTQTTAIVIKPVDSNLASALSIATNERFYTVKLVSRLKDWMPKVSFAYPESVDEAWASYHREKESYDTTVTMADGQRNEDLYFNYKITGDSPLWKPVRVYDDGEKTYIQFSEAMRFNEAPALVSLSGSYSIWDDPVKEVVNYRLKGDRYVVDKVVQRMSLISGVGDQQVAVNIARQ